MFHQDIKQLQSLIESSHNIVFLGGAGVSTESNIPDFRSDQGRYRQTFNHPPEVILSHSFFQDHPAEFYEFYRSLLFPEAQPNQAHIKLAQWEKAGKIKAIITQNIDGLHQKAGSERVFELHGSVWRNYCQNCHRFYDLNFITNAKGIPRCSCGGTVKPDVVLYEEKLNSRVLSGAVAAIKEADMFIIGGTSLLVYPAAGLLNDYTGNKLVLINKEATPYDEEVNLRLQGNIGQIFSQLP